MKPSPSMNRRRLRRPNDGLNYAGLAKLAFGRDPRETRGRKKVLRGQKLGSLLYDIAHVSAADPQIGRQEIARQLLEYSRYKRLPAATENARVRKMQRYVAAALAWEVDILKRVPPHLWPELLGIEPPAEMTEQALCEKALEALRELRRQDM